MARLRGEGKIVEADEAAKAGLKKLDDLAKREKHGKRLLDDALVEGVRSKIEDERLALALSLETEFEAVKAKAAEAQKDASVASYEAAIAIWRRFRETHPAPEGKEGPLATAMVTQAGLAQKAIADIEGRLESVKQADLRVDRADYHGLLLTYYLDKSDASAGGLYRRFRFGEAVVAATARVKAAKTQAYRDLAQRRLDESNRLATFLDRVPKMFQGVAIREPLSGTGGGGWKAVVKDVTSDGVLADGVRRPFADESLAFFLGLFYDAKGKERVPLDPDAHEALALVAAIGVTVESADFLPLFEAEAKRATEADPARAPRLEALRKEATAEAVARALWDDAWKSVAEANAEMDRLHSKIDVVDEKASRAGREETIAKEPELVGRLKKARESLRTLERDHPSSHVLAAHVEAPPLRAAWAGETPPPPPAPATPPAPPAPGPEPAMAEPPAMKEEAGATKEEGPKEEGPKEEPAMR
jgi:hypothetical protein